MIQKDEKGNYIGRVVAPSEEVKQKSDDEIYIKKLEGLLRNYRDHVGWHEGIDYLRESDDSQYLTSDDMKFIKDL